MELKDYLKSEDTYLETTNYQLIMNRVNELIYEENLEMNNTLYDCVRMYCKAHNKEFSQKSMIECIALLIEIGLTRHIIKNINNFDIYGYGKYKEMK